MLFLTPTRIHSYTVLPLVGGVPFYDFTTTIDGNTYAFDVRWNETAAAWFMDVFEESGKPIRRGIKIVLGVHLGRACTHRLFRTGVFVVVDRSRSRTDATFEDLGTRVEVRRYTMAQLLAAHGYVEAG